MAKLSRSAIRQIWEAYVYAYLIRWANDPESRCNDVTDKGRWGNGDVEIGVSSPDEIEYALFLIRQSFEKHTDEISM